VGIVSRQDLKEALELVEKTYSLFRAKGLEVLVDQEIANVSANPDIRRSASSIRELKTVDIIVVLGGDGTILQTVRRLRPPLRILGVNMGYMGFFCEVEPEELGEVVDKILKGECYLQKVGLLSVKVNGLERDVALNDVLIFTSELAKTLEFTVKADGIEIFSGRADGVLVSSTVGSTAYALSAGGPLIDPLVECLVVVALNPLKLGTRPIVLPSNSKVEVSLSRYSLRTASIYSDGAFTCHIGVEDVVEICKSSHQIELVRVKDFRGSFYKKFYEVRIRGGKARPPKR
jgi:NAD+ kinase